VLPWWPLSGILVVELSSSEQVVVFLSTYIVCAFHLLTGKGSARPRKESV